MTSRWFLAICIALISTSQGTLAEPASCIAELKSLLSSPDGRFSVFKESLAKVPDLKTLATKRYGKDVGMRYLSRLSKLRDDHLPLIADPTAMYWIDELIAFAKKNRTSDTWGIRRDFRKQMGYDFYFRGMALRPADVGMILQNGIDSRYLRPGNDHIVRYNETDIFTHNVFSMIAERIMGGLTKAPPLPTIDTLISVTKDPDLARTVTRWYLEEDPSLQVFVFKLWLPRMDTFAAPGADPAKESFVFFKIFPHEIIDVQHVAD